VTRDGGSGAVVDVETRILHSETSSLGHTTFSQSQGSTSTRT
jgi:hypothetical protein